MVAAAMATNLLYSSKFQVGCRLPVHKVGRKFYVLIDLKLTIVWTFI
jgi:hypothetical protein